MQQALGGGYHVYENALNGRTTVFEDPIEEGRCGKTGFSTILEVNAPLDLVIVMLGCNDCKQRFLKSPWDIAWGIDLLIQYIRRTPCGVDGQPPEILIAAPIRFGSTWDQTILGTVFGPRSTEICEQLPDTYRYVTEKNRCHFLDAGHYAAPGVDCVHLTEEGHRKLGEAFTRKSKEIILGRKETVGNGAIQG
jgi:lysophospholipase L1-like esterase